MSTPSDSIPTVCDLVMKGGIASGVVYPGAIAVLAQTYRFHRIGGSSAGAIAAAMTAAAEYRRQGLLAAGRSDEAQSAFTAIAALPMALGAAVAGHSRLFSLFAPQPPLRRAWSTLTALAGGGRFALLRMFAAGLAASPWLLLAAVPAMLLFALAMPTGNPVALPLQLVLTTAFVVLSLAIAVALQLLRDLRQLGEHGFGFCTGGNATDDPTPRLSAWLHAQIQHAAGLPLDRPLTFADLWSATHPYDGTPGTADRPGIDLRVTTTNLTWQQLMSMPSAGGDYDRLHFDRDEIARWLPPPVVAALIAAGEILREERADDPDRSGTDTIPAHLLPLPLAQLPVLLAVRMSLSFPLLLTPVRLYARDSRRWGPAMANTSEQERVDIEAKQQFRDVWFSDGGICSNMPVHFFDTALPTHPTFAINLSAPHPDHALRPQKTPLVGVPSHANYGAGPYWVGWKEGEGGVLAFVSGIIDAARNWSDFTQMRLDGHRDRIMHVALAPDEGGMNLDMPAELIERLSGRGAEAATLMRDLYTRADAYAGGVSVWQRHRWLRTRVGLFALAEFLDDIRTNAEASGMQGADEIADWIEQSPGSRRLRADARNALHRMLEQLAPIIADRDLLESILTDEDLGDPGDGDTAPRRRMSRRPELRLRARL